MARYSARLGDNNSTCCCCTSVAFASLLIILLTSSVTGPVHSISVPSSPGARISRQRRCRRGRRWSHRSGRRRLQRQQPNGFAVVDVVRRPLVVQSVHHELNQSGVVQSNGFSTNSTHTRMHPKYHQPGRESFGERTEREGRKGKEDGGGESSGVNIQYIACLSSLSRQRTKSRGRCSLARSHQVVMNDQQRQQHPRHTMNFIIRLLVASPAHHDWRLNSTRATDRSSYKCSTTHAQMRRRYLYTSHSATEMQTFLPPTWTRSVRIACSSLTSSSCSITATYCWDNDNEDNINVVWFGCFSG